MDGSILSTWHWQTVPVELRVDQKDARCGIIDLNHIEPLMGYPILIPYQWDTRFWSEIHADLLVPPLRKHRHRLCPHSWQCALAAYAWALGFVQVPCHISEMMNHPIVGQRKVWDQGKRFGFLFPAKSWQTNPRKVSFSFIFSNGLAETQGKSA